MRQIIGIYQIPSELDLHFTIQPVLRCKVLELNKKLKPDEQPQLCR